MKVDYNKKVQDACKLLEEVVNGSNDEDLLEYPDELGSLDEVVAKLRVIRFNVKQTLQDEIEEACAGNGGLQEALVEKMINSIPSMIDDVYKERY